MARLSQGQRRIAKAAKPKNKITGADFKALKRKKKKTTDIFSYSGARYTSSYRSIERCTRTGYSNYRWYNSIRDESPGE